MTEETFPFVHTINASRVIDKDEKVLVEPTEAELKELASAYEIDAIKSLKGDFLLKPYRKAGVRVVGTISLETTQTCVVSLEPFETALALEVDRTFEPYSTKPRKIRDLNDDGEIEIDLESLDPPDVMKDGVLDLGAVICEEIALALDPFPRKPGVEFEDPNPEPDDAERDDSEKPSPFAALGALKGDTKS